MKQKVVHRHKGIDIERIEFATGNVYRYTLDGVSMEDETLSDAKDTIDDWAEGETMTNESTKHTPGPWKAANADTDASGTFNRILSMSEAEITPARAYGDTEEQRHANARLIAAAPDMLATLENIAAHAYDDDTPIEDIYADFDRMKRAAEIAIARLND